MIPPHTMLSTFDVRASASAAQPDELMFDCSKLPPGSALALYFPAAGADALLASAASRYGKNTIFTRLDAHTVQTSARGFVYLPIPAQAGNLGGLMAVILSAGLPAGRTCQITVSQITTKQGGTGRQIAPLAALPPQLTHLLIWRQTCGLFNLKTTIVDAAKILPQLERNYAILLWIFSGIPADSRWYPVFVRYLGVLANQITAGGGNPHQITANANGVVPITRSPYTPCHPLGVLPPLTGKIEGLIFDHFGDFEGFILATETGETYHFYSRESHMKDVAERAWAQRLRVTIFPAEKDQFMPIRLVLHPSAQPI